MSREPIALSKLGGLVPLHQVSLRRAAIEGRLRTFQLCPRGKRFVPFTEVQDLVSRLYDVSSDEAVSIIESKLKGVR